MPRAATAAAASGGNRATTYAEGSLVWATVPGSPPWPARVRKPHTADQKREAKSVAKGSTARGLVMVEFLDGSFAFVLPPAIELYLGSDAKSLPKRAKSAALRAALREADAIYEAESQDKVKAEQDSDEDDERAAAAVEDDISTYEAQRLANIRQNAEMLSKLGLDAPIVESASPAAREKRAARGLRQRAHRPVAPTEPTRRSRRVAGLDVHGEPLPPGEKSSFFTDEPLVAREPPQGDVDAVQGPLDEPDQDEEMHDYRRGIMSVLAGVRSQAAKPAVLSGHKHLLKLKMGERGVTKVVPERIYSVAVHPNAERTILMTGDKRGSFGMLDLDNADENACVALFRPHIRPISAIHVDPTNVKQIYTSSYEGVVRCWDVGHSVFREAAVFGADVDFLAYSDILWSSRTIIGCHGDGSVTLTDMRAGKSPQSIHVLHNRKVSHAHVNPHDNNLMVTTSLDTNLYIWDLRTLGKKANKPLCTGGHKMSINGAYFSPVTGNKLISLGHDDVIKVYHDVLEQTKKGGELKSRSIPHNNNTGRWLTNFKPTWDPKCEDYFVVGSRLRPRAIDVFDTASGHRICQLQDAEQFTTVTSLHAFHPTRNLLVGGNASGRLFVLHD